MQGTHHIDDTGTADDGDGLDPREAARLLAQTEREARRQFNLSPRWTSGVMGVVILVAYGSLWLSTRGQHPYTDQVLAWSRWCTRRWWLRSPCP